MKRFCSLIIVIFLLDSFIIAQIWTPIGPNDFNQPSYYPVSHTSIATDKVTGIPYVVYKDEGNGNKATVAKYTSGTWSIVGTAGFSSAAIENAIITIAPDGTPYVVFQIQNSNSLILDATVMKFISGSWSVVGAGSLNAQQVAFNNGFFEFYPNIALAIAPDNTPYLAYGDYNSVVNATVKKFDGSNWVVVGGLGFSGAQARSISLAIAQNDGTPYVLFSDDQAFTQNSATVMKYNGANWVLVGAQGFSNSSVIAYPSIAITSDGIPYVAYQDVTHSSKVNVMQYNGSTWVNVGASIGFSTGTAQHVSLAIASDFTPYVAYKDVSNGNKATVKKFDGSNWVNAGSAGFSAGAVEYTSMSIYFDGVDDIPFVIYKDATNNLRATVKKLGADWTTVGFTGLSNGSASYTSATIGAGGNMYVAYKDNNNKVTVRKNISGTWDIAGNEGLSSGTADFISLTYNTADSKPYVAYKDGANSGKATVKFLAPDNAWTTIGTEGFSTGSTSYTSLAISTTGTPYLAYADVTLANRSIVKAFNGSSWVNTGSQPVSTGSATCISLALSTAGTPYLAYTDADISVANKAIVKTFNGSNWVNVGTQPISSGIASHISLGVAPGSVNPYIAYADANNSNRATVKTYNGTAWVDVGPAGGFSAGTASNLSLAFATDATPYLAYQDGANGNRLTVKKFTAGVWTTVISEGISAGTAGNISLVIGNDIPNVAYTDGYAWVQGICSSASLTWIGSVSSAWENPLNWSCGIIPIASSEVVISTGSPFFPVISSNISIKKVTVNTGASLTVSPGFNLTITGTD
ncbi:MAG: hypothetical protein WBC06_16805 [Chitinophagaceae bacterium]